jgi:hypothetical protein
MHPCVRRKYITPYEGRAEGTITDLTEWILIGQSYAIQVREM